MLAPRSLIGTVRRHETSRAVVRLALIGVLNTVDYFILFNLFRVAGLGLVPSVTVAFAMATFVSYVLNRRWTFELAANAGGVHETARFYLVNVAAWAVTVLFITACDRLFGPLDRLGENLASLVAAGVILLPKFLSYRDLVFRKALVEARRARALAARPDPG